MTSKTDPQSAVRALLQASAVLLSNHQLPGILQGILNIAQEVLAADAYAVWRKADRSEHWQIEASRGLSDIYIRDSAAVYGDLTLAQHPIVLDDLHSDPRLSPRTEALIAEGIAAMAAFPILVNAVPSATIVFYFRSAHHFSPEELDYASTVANLAGAAITNSELIRKQEDSAKRSELLARITSLFNSSLDFNRTAQAVADAVVPSMADWCALSLYSGGKLTRVAVAHQDPAMIRVANEFGRRYPEQLDPERGVLKVINSGEPELITGITDQMLQAAARDPDHLSLMRALKVCSLITVPLQLAGRPIGVLRLVSSNERPDLSQEDVVLAQEIAGRAANALQNAQLFTMVQKELEARRAAEARLDRERSFLALAQRVANAGSFELDLRANPATVIWSQELLEIYGMQPDNFHGLYQNWIDVLHPDDRDPAVKSVQRAIDEKKPWQHEFRIIRPDGAVRWMTGRAQCFYNDDGSPRTLIGINMDVTERRAAEAALLRSEKLSSAGRLAASIAHEINNPLEAVTNLIFLARDSDPPQKDQLLEEADRELQRIAHITRQTLGFYRESAAPREFDVEEMVMQVLALLGARLQRRRIVPEAELPPVRLEAVEGEIRQVVSNLLTNAIDACPEGGAVRLRSQKAWIHQDGRPRRAVRISIADNGAGIPPQSRAHIFEPFYTTKQDVGTGLGLWVVREIVNKHGGRVQVRSCSGSGTVFSILLPASQSPLV